MEVWIAVMYGTRQQRNKWTLCSVKGLDQMETEPYMIYMVEGVLGCLP